MASVERLLQREVMLRLSLAPLAAIVVPSPNGVFLPGVQRALAQRIIHQLKRDGQLLPGAPDLIVLWSTGSGCIELKRPTERDLLGVRRYKGNQNPDQKVFEERCTRLGVPYAICHSWEEVRDTLVSWGRLPASWGVAA